VRFADEASIYVKGGNGGDGCVSFRREKYVPRGGPDGGDGGDGGSVVVEVVHGLLTLADVVSRANWSAGDGKRGEPRNRHGANGRDLVIRVPRGTLVIDRDTGLTLADLDEAGRRITVARGGGGGRGNAAFASAVNQTPRQYEQGRTGQARNLQLELRMVADVGLVGLPNAGKSTLLSSVSSAHPKVADYPFTTLWPVIGIVQNADYETFVAADLPGLIRGAHGGRGLGDQFLRHVERTRVLLHVVDAAPAGQGDPVDNYRAVRDELVSYDASLGAKVELVAANKIDLPGARDGVARLRAELSTDVVAVSALTGEGVPALIERLFQALGSLSG
jgi:GTP-binding protein